VENRGIVRGGDLYSVRPEVIKWERSEATKRKSRN
jgi:hypothetical protein